TAAMVPILVAELDRNRAVHMSKIPERKRLIVEVEVAESALVKPVVAGMVDHDVENDPDGEGLPVFRKSMGGVDQIDQVLCSAEVRIEAKVVRNVVPMVRVRVVLEHR